MDHARSALVDVHFCPSFFSLELFCSRLVRRIHKRAFCPDVDSIIDFIRSRRRRFAESNSGQISNTLVARRSKPAASQALSGEPPRTFLASTLTSDGVRRTLTARLPHQRNRGMVGVLNSRQLLFATHVLFTKGPVQQHGSTQRQQTIQVAQRLSRGRQVHMRIASRRRDRALSHDLHAHRLLHAHLH